MLQKKQPINKVVSLYIILICNFYYIKFKLLEIIYLFKGSELQIKGLPDERVFPNKCGNCSPIVGKQGKLKIVRNFKQKDKNVRNNKKENMYLTICPHKILQFICNII